jgi:hypothetical protein
MRLATFLLLLAATVSSFAAGKSEPLWKIHYEAEKGDMTVSVPNGPAPLDSYLHQLPSYSPDPFDHEAKIANTDVRIIGSFRAHQVVEAHIQVREPYYTDLYLLLYEMQPGLYLPIYAQQYNRGVRTPELTAFSTNDRRCSITVTVQYSGTAASRTSDNITLSQDGRGRVQLRCRHK